jgi:hypothetical protein
MNRPTLSSITFRIISAMTFVCLVAGCAKDVWKDQPERVISDYYVPKSAKKVAESTDVFTFTAPTGGIIYVQDVDQPTTIYSVDGSTKTEAYKVVLQALLVQGNEYYFDPHTGKAGVRNSQRAPSSVQTIPGHKYRAMFDTKETKGY